MISQCLTLSQNYQTLIQPVMTATCQSSMPDCHGGLWEEFYVGNFKTFWEAPDLIRRQEIHPFLMLQQGTQ